jgi:hypothetical protein
MCFGALPKKIFGRWQNYFFKFPSMLIERFFIRPSIVNSDTVISHITFLFTMK